MALGKSGAARKAKVASPARDALTLLTAGHEEIEGLSHEFQRRRRTIGQIEKGKLALRLCRALDVQAVLRREVFYPAARAVLDEDGCELVDILLVEQEVVDRLVIRIRNMPAGEPTFDVTVMVLAEQAARSMKKEEEELFPLLRHSGLDLQGIGERMAARRTQLTTAPADRRTIRRARRVLSPRGRRAR